MDWKKQKSKLKQERKNERTMQMICKNKNKDYIGIWSSGCSDIRTGKEEGKLQEDRLPNLDIRQKAVARLCAARH